MYRASLQEGERSTGSSETFIQEIESLEASDPDSAFDWTTSNATITLNDSHYNNLNSYQSFDVIAQEYIDSLPDTNNKDSKQYALNEYKELQLVKKDLFRQHRKIKNPLEVDVKNMQGPIRDRIREIDERITDLQKELAIPQDLYKNVGDSTSRRTVNEDFEKMSKECMILR